jgi:uncharacterized protein YjiS (DUF1127 family)
MSDVVIHPARFSSGAALRFRRFTALLGRSLHRATIADDTGRTLDELPDNLLRDIGLARSEIPFVAEALASGYRAPGSDALDRLDRTVPERGAAVRRLPRVVFASRGWPW